jgi:hypothetical protein
MIISRANGTCPAPEESDDDWYRAEVIILTFNNLSSLALCPKNKD